MAARMAMECAGAVFGPRERMMDAGVEFLGDAEILALVLGTGQRGEPVLVLAASLLAEVGGLTGLGRGGVGELAKKGGIGPAKAARLVAATELGKRIQGELSRVSPFAFPESRAVEAWARPRLAALEHEELWALALDGRHRLKAARRVAMGGLHGLHVAARDPLRSMLREGASAFVLVHNHPSGDPTPSAEDVTFTERIAAAGDFVATPLLDHLIIGKPGYVSMLDAGVLSSRRSTRPRDGPRKR